MFKGRTNEEFKQDAVAQIVERGDGVAQGSQRLSVSQHSLYAWDKKFAETARSSCFWPQSKKGSRGHPESQGLFNLQI